MLSFDDVNWLAVIVAVLVHQVLGFLWYGPLFGKAWLAAMNKRPEDVGGPGPAIAIGVVGSVLTAIALALFISLAEEPDLGTGIAYGAVAAIGFAGASIATSAAFEGKNQTVTALFIAYQLVGLILMGAILGAWQ